MTKKINIQELGSVDDLELLQRGDVVEIRTSKRAVDPSCRAVYHEHSILFGHSFVIPIDRDELQFVSGIKRKNSHTKDGGLMASSISNNPWNIYNLKDTCKDYDRYNKTLQDAGLREGR